MADDTVLNAGTGGDTIATDDVGGVKYQRVKITVGADGTAVGDVSSANPMPVVNSAAVTVTGSVTAAITGPVTVQGSVTAAITGPVTVSGTVAATQSGTFSVVGGVIASITGPVTVQGSVTAAITGPVTVTGSVTAAITGPVTVTGTVAATQSGAWSISATSNLANLLGASIDPGVTVVGTIGIGKRVDALSATVGSTVGAAVSLQTDAFGALWVVASSLGIAGPVTVQGSVGISGPVTVQGSVTSAITGPVTVQGSVGITGPVTVTGSVSAVGQVSIVGVVPAHTIFGSVSLAGGSVGIAGPVTVMGTVTANLSPTATGGLSTWRSLTLGSAAATVSATAASIFGMWVTNTATSTRFIKFYNTTIATVSSTTPQVTIGIPGNSSDDVAGLFSSAHGIAFTTAILAGATTEAPDAASVGATSGDVLINVFYK